MATRAVASAVFPLPLSKVWEEVRDFTFNGKYFSTIESSIVLDGRSSDSVGATRETKWKSGEVQRHRLIELSDQNYRVTWELIDSEPASEVLATITTVSLYRVSETNETLVEWAGDFSADVSADLVHFHHNAFLENLKELRTGLANKN